MFSPESNLGASGLKQRLLFLRAHNTAASVSGLWCPAKKALEPEDYKCLFQVILTDRGIEFTDPVKIETRSESVGPLCRGSHNSS